MLSVKRSDLKARLVCQTNIYMDDHYFGSHVLRFGSGMGWHELLVPQKAV